MLTTLSIRDFQSLAEVDLQLGPFTVVVGAGNKGKTAAVRALKALAFNRTGSDFIRHGQQMSVVIVETSEGQRIAWVKDKTTARYMVDDLELTKMAGAVPEEVREALGIRRMEVEAGSMAVPQIHMQFDSPFLLAESPSKAARTVAKLTRLDVIVSAQTQAARDLKRVTSDLKAQRVALDAAQEASTTTAAEAHQAQAKARQVTALYDAVLSAEEDVHRAVNAVTSLNQARVLATRRLPTAADFEEVDALLDRRQEGGQARLAWVKSRDELERVLTEVDETEVAIADSQGELATVEACPVCGRPLEDDDDDHDSR